MLSSSTAWTFISSHLLLLSLIFQLLQQQCDAQTTEVPDLSIPYGTATYKLAIAAGMGATIGALQKFLTFKETLKIAGSAGVRTHTLVAMGACLVQLVSLHGYSEYWEKVGRVTADPARLPAQVISGLGFLGAGTILRHGDAVIRGLPSAASLWVAGTIGIAVATTMWYAALVVTILTCITLYAVKKFEDAILKKRSVRTIFATVDNNPKTLVKMANYINKECGTLVSIQTHPQYGDHGVAGQFVSMDVKVEPEFYDKLEESVYDLAQMEGVKFVSLKNTQLHGLQAIELLSQMAQHSEGIARQTTTMKRDPNNDNNVQSENNLITNDSNHQQQATVVINPNAVGKV